MAIYVERVVSRDEGIDGSRIFPSAETMDGEAQVDFYDVFFLTDRTVTGHGVDYSPFFFSFHQPHFKVPDYHQPQ